MLIPTQLKHYVDVLTQFEQGDVQTIYYCILFTLTWISW